MKPTLIKFNELRFENDTFTMYTALVNPAHIVTVRSGKIEKEGAVIIGQQREREVRMITCRNAAPLYVDESIEEIYDRIAQAE